MKIKVDELQRHPGMSVEYDIRDALPAVTLAGDTAVFQEPVRLKVTGVNTGYTITVEGTIGAVATLTCGRCLEKYTYSIVEPMREEFIRAGDTRQPEEGSLELGTRVFTGETIDLTEVVLEVVTLALPMKRVCRESCRGLCPRCGVSLNEQSCDCSDDTTDSRLAVLSKLIKRE